MTENTLKALSTGVCDDCTNGVLHVCPLIVRDMVRAVLAAEDLADYFPTIAVPPGGVTVMPTERITVNLDPKFGQRWPNSDGQPGDSYVTCAHPREVFTVNTSAADPHLNRHERSCPDCPAVAVSVTGDPGPLPPWIMLSTVHRCPEGDAGITPCCGRSPMELRHTDRITLHDELVTCHENTRHRPGILTHDGVVLSCTGCGEPLPLPPVAGPPGSSGPWVSIAGMDGWTAPPLMCPDCSKAVR